MIKWLATVCLMFNTLIASYQPLVEISHFDSARQSQTEALRSERGAPSRRGKDDEEDRFGKAAASQNGKFQLEAGIDDIPEPYRSVKDLPFDSHGWFVNSDALRPILKAKAPKVVIEIGSWLGSSTRFIATMIPEGSVVYAVDTWLGSPAESYHREDPRYPFLYQLFLSNVKQAGLTKKIIPIRMNSLEAAKALNIKAQVIYIDAAHDTESVKKDILAWYPHLEEYGTMCGDDWFSFESVRIAVQQCAPILGKKVNASGNFWWYE